MPKITFIKDVPNEDGSIAYRAGYCCDVTAQQARRYVQSGNAVDGVVEVQVEEPKPAKKRGLGKKTKELKSEAVSEG